MTTVHVVVPEGLDDPALPSGGNVYDRRICRGLERLGRSVDVRAVPGSWPRPDPAALRALADTVADLPDDGLVVVDGLIASAVPEVLVPASRRLRLVVLVHLPLGCAQAGELDDAGDGAGDGAEPTEVRARERAVLSAAAAVVVTSGWTRRWLLARYGLRHEAVHVVEPGVDVADPASGTTSGRELLCVAAVTPEKGHDVLVAALATLTDLSWRCLCVGALTRDPAFARRVEHQARAAGIDDRVGFAGPRTGADLQAAYAAADVLLLASRTETYGMVVTEALARGLPVVATAVGGVPETLGRTGDGSRPGLLVPPEDPPEFGAALRAWLSEDALRQRLRRVAAQRRTTLSGWPAAAEAFSRVLEGVAR